MTVLGVQRVGGDDRAGDVDAVGQRCEGVDLVGLAVYYGLTITTPVAWSNAASRRTARQSVSGPPASALPVDGDHP
jgi:hypothetical protein